LPIGLVVKVDHRLFVKLGAQRVGAVGRGGGQLWI
jgi:hypothetical protein